jgi:hypothetical protein
LNQWALHVSALSLASNLIHLVDLPIHNVVLAHVKKISFEKWMRIEVISDE